MGVTVHIFDLVIGVLLVIGCHAFFLVRDGFPVSRDRVAAALWGLPFVLLLCGFVFLDVKGWLECEWSFTPAMVSLIVGGCLMAFRPHVTRYQRGLPVSSALAFTIFRDVLLMLGAAVLSVVLIELPWNDEFYALPANMVLLNFAMIALGFVCLYFLGLRSGSLVAVGMSFLFFVGIAQYFISQFKQSSILPSDLMALGTAMAVSDGYDFVFTDSIVSLVPWYSAAIVLLSFMVPVRPRIFGKRRYSMAIEGALGCIFCFAFALALVTTDFVSTFGCTNSYWDPLGVYKTQGFLPSFTSLAHSLAIKEPEGYSDQKADQLEEGYASQYDAIRGSSEGVRMAQEQFAGQKPAIVAIMNESYADLSVFNGLEGGYEGAAYPRTLQDGIVGGKVLSSVFGGGTCNSEFEFLTGVSMAHVGFGTYPFTSYNLSNIASLPKQLNPYGYTSTAIHPYIATNWNRDVIYGQIGFDEFIDRDDFDGGEWYHAGLSDACSYAKILDILRDDSSPQFIFDVTIQNHGGYDWGNIPADQLPSYSPQGVSDTVRNALNEYVACINKSDADLAWFLNELRVIGRPVVVVFFGDHQPAFTKELNDAAFGDTDSIEGQARIYETPYFMWANYDLPSSDQVSQYMDTNICNLAGLLLECVGVPLTKYQKSSLALQETLSYLNVFGYRSPDGQWYSLDDDESPYSDLVNDRAAIQYRNFAELI